MLRSAGTIASTSWVAIIMVHPGLWVRVIIICMMPILVDESRFAVGLSDKSRVGLWATARTPSFLSREWLNRSLPFLFGGNVPVTNFRPMSV